MPEINRKVFRYSFGTIAPGYLGVLVMSLLAVLGVRESIVGDTTTGVLLFVPALFLLIVALFGLRQSCAIYISSDGIRARSFGHTFRFISWVSLKTILSVREYNQASLKYKYTFYLSDQAIEKNIHVRRLSSNAKRGAILFDEQIIGIQDLLGVINGVASRYGIPILAVDREADSSRGKTLWRKTEPIENRYPVSALTIGNSADHLTP